MSRFKKFSVFSMVLAALFIISSLTTSSHAQLGDEGVPNSVFAILPESPGANCANGGSLIASGLDKNGNGLLNFNEVQFVSYACNGEPGPQGPQGLQGSTGATGATGPAGADGAVGAQGPQGEVGPEGPQGVAGVDGADGADGQDGADGAEGPQGPAGNDGLNVMDLCTDQEVLLADGTCLDLSGFAVDACENVVCGDVEVCQNGQCCAVEVVGNCTGSGTVTCDACTGDVCFTSNSSFVCCTGEVTVTCPFNG